MASKRRIEWPGQDEEYRRCGECDRCRHDAGRDKNPAASDCYDDMLRAATQPPGRKP